MHRDSVSVPFSAVLKQLEQSVLVNVIRLTLRFLHDAAAPLFFF